MGNISPAKCILVCTVKIVLVLFPWPQGLASSLIVSQVCVLMMPTSLGDWRGAIHFDISCVTFVTADVIGAISPACR
jgi:hypothetical protein